MVVGLVSGLGKLRRPRLGAAVLVPLPVSTLLVAGLPLCPPRSKQHDFGSDIIPGAKEQGCKVQAHLFKG